MFEQLQEWELWMHPYPSMIKGRSRKLDPKKFPTGRIFKDGAELVRLSSLFEGRKRTPVQLKRCVVAVAKKHGGDTKKAFAICTAQLQKTGYLKVGTQTPTKAGKAAGRSKAAEKGHSSKVGEYEDLLAANRKGSE